VQSKKKDASETKDDKKVLDRGKMKKAKDCK